MSQASGVAIGPGGYILTSLAAVDGAGQLAVRHPGGFAGQAQVSLADPSLGLVALRLDGDGLPIARPGNVEGATEGVSVLAGGFETTAAPAPTGVAGRLVIRPEPTDRSDPSRIHFTGPISSGLRVGALFDQSGAVLGIIVDVPGSAGGLGTAIRSDRRSSCSSGPGAVPNRPARLRSRHAHRQGIRIWPNSLS